MNRLQDYIEKLNLQPHPEGGYYRRNWQSSFTADVVDSSGKVTHPRRALGSSILYFLAAPEFCAWHRLTCEEMWHHYAGSSLKIHLLSMQNGWETFVLGSEIMNGELPQIIIPPRTWFCAELVDSGSFGFYGCTLWPSFTYADFELAELHRLLDEFPKFADKLKPWFKQPS